MASTGTRTTRSRYSSPQQPAQGQHDPTKNSEHKRQTTLKEWYEPPVQSKPSYQDANLMAVGVLEGMGPLDVPPKASNLKKIAGGEKEHTSSYRKIILKNRPSTAPKPAPPSTPQMDESEDNLTPAPTRRSVSSKDVDDDYTPHPKAPSTSRLKITRNSISRASAPQPSSTPSQQQTPAVATPTRPSRPEKMPEDKEAIDKIVERAVDEALEHFRYPTAFALRTLYDENSSNAHFLAMVQDIYQQTADAETIEEFARMVYEKKKEGKKDDKGCYYFVPPSTNSLFTPRKPVAAPYKSLLKLEIPKLSVDGDRHLRKKVKPNSFHESAHKMAANGVKGSAAHPSPLRNRKRADSAGSDSSLSSAKSVTPPAEQEAEGEGDHVLDAGGPGRNSSAGGANNASDPATRQPMAGRKRNVTTTKKHGNVSPTPTPTPSSPTADLAPSARGAGAASSMPAAVDSPLLTKLAKQSSKQPDDVIKFPSRFGPVQDDAKERLKRLAKKVTNARAGEALSWERPHAAEPGRDAGRASRAPAAVARPRPSLPPPAPLTTTRATRSQKRNHEEVDDDAAPSTPNVAAESGSLASGVNSRAATPNPRAAKKARTGLRVKTSPMKKKTGPSAGIPRPPGERNSPPANGQSNNQDENDDYCSSCGGNGELVCCDGCTRSFHFKCVDPPMVEGPLPDEWFCHVCFSARYPDRVPDHGGAFGQLLNALEKKNSSAFRLPGEIRDYFDGVKTGVDGEYEEVAPPTKTKKKAGAEEVLDFFKQRDADGNPVICHQCERPAAKDRAIIPCSLCGLYWHLDCLDPPQAHAPVPRTFRCPGHIDDLLAKIPAALGPAHRFRKIKGTPIIKPVYSRGNVNNGWINVEGDWLDSPIAWTKPKSAWNEPESFGHQYTLQPETIIADFKEKCRKERPKTVPAPQLAQVHVPRNNEDWERQQAALNMVRFSQPDQSGVAELITALVDNADPAMVSMIARGDAQHFDDGPLSLTDEHSLMAMSQQLEAIQAQIKARLESLRCRSLETSPVPPAASPEMGNVETGDSTTSVPPLDPIVQDEQVPSPALGDDSTEVADSLPTALPAVDGAEEPDHSDPAKLILDTTPSSLPVSQTEKNDDTQEKTLLNGSSRSQSVARDTPEPVKEALDGNDTPITMQSSPDAKAIQKDADATKMDVETDSANVQPEAMDIDKDLSQLPTP
ncbi:Transcriptional regulatory protein RCO1 [Pleurostoma richardsiae]|uniref:Transcriptional regulatory protein RCO1 n=1 Tax=Pleurostoma richardsiae TaxID=41990 RepID=A0AA38S7L2_9PEZI|nr:Transcriptional regulatory protein RCO1 [Pleurostoma richardsiae]